MPIEQMNISLSPQMARFIRSRVKKGAYTNVSEVVRDAVRRMQEAEAFKKERAMFADSERSRVRQGIRDIEAGRFEDYDRHGLTRLANELVETSVKRQRRSKAG
ncbi:MAG: type II toxin-antitoxin system ParD family antitoxin [Acidobacteriia bacterium]|nr:type II toxin-antitoxin system ParD family antitoxin [Terriglobia bacterium]